MLDLLKRVVLIIGVILFYFFIFRSARVWGHDQLLGSLLPDSYGTVNSDVGFFSPSTVGFMLYRIGENPENGWQYKMPFGSFFLFAMIGLIAIKSGKSGYFQLIGLHLAGFIIATIAVWIALKNVTNALVITDFISRYLVPVGSLGLVAISHMQKKNEDQREY